MSNRSYAQIREDNILWALKELRKNYVVFLDETIKVQETYPEVENLKLTVARASGCVEALDSAIAILKPGPRS